MAAAVALAILVLVLGCVMDDVWWSMFTTVAYLCAAIGWALTQPGFICGQQQGAAFGNTREGMCGGDLFPLWGAWRFVCRRCFARRPFAFHPASHLIIGRRSVARARRLLLHGLLRLQLVRRQHGHVALRRDPGLVLLEQPGGSHPGSRITLRSERGGDQPDKLAAPAAHGWCVVVEWRARESTPRKPHRPARRAQWEAAHWVCVHGRGGRSARLIR